MNFVRDIFMQGLTFELKARKVYPSSPYTMVLYRASPFRNTATGKVIYVDHPNGYTSVYAHLSKFNNAINNLVTAHHYQTQSYEFDLQVDSGKIEVKQGEVIAWSGNTGGSAGPHLHFEVRNTKSETPINPLHFGFEVKDNLAPTIKNLSIYPLNESSAVNGISKTKTYSLIKSGNVYKLNSNSLPQLKGKIGFGVEAIDKVNLSPFPKWGLQS